MEEKYLYFDFGAFEVKLPYKIQGENGDLTANLDDLIISWQ